VNKKQNSKILENPSIAAPLQCQQHAYTLTAESNVMLRAQEILSAC